MWRSRGVLVGRCRTTLEVLGMYKSMSLGRRERVRPLHTHDYAPTLRLPHTNFPMRAQANEREPLWLSHVTDEAYQWQRAKNTGDTWFLHDGPPYANGGLHMGHALNKILKDIINRYKAMRGYRVAYCPGWDCHGLPIELKALEQLKVEDRRNLPPLEIRRLARELASKAIEVQKQGFQRWGVMGDYERCYSTMDKAYELRQLAIFGDMAQRGYIHRGLRPVYWSPASRTALAEAELEYVPDHTSRSAYVAFPLRRLGPAVMAKLSSFSNVHLLIWTTTPWTLPANKAICYAANATYSVVEMTGPGHVRFVLVAQNLVESLQRALNCPLTEITTIQGHELEGCLYTTPLKNPDCVFPLLCGDHVTLDQGTGLVHTAPGHGYDDFHVCQRHKIPILCPVDASGGFTEEAGPSLAGLSVLKEGNDAVIRMLAAKGVLVREVPYVHKYPYDWRTKTPLIIRTTEQWFISLDRTRSQALEALNDVQFTPHTAKRRLVAFVEGRDEWCISRQRVWGVPIPAFHDDETGAAVLIVEAACRVFEKAGTDAWWSDVYDEELRTAALRRMQSTGLNPPPERLRKGEDTMDVWLDSGLSWTYMLYDCGSKFPADMFLEGSDQHRGWFQSSLLTSVANMSRAPYRDVVTHGFVLDSEQRKMSKSEGNILDPWLIVNGGKDRKKDPPHGADILRLWVGSVDYTSDVTISPIALSKVAESYRRIRNALRFMLGNLSEFSYRERVEKGDMQSMDIYMMHRLAELSRDVTLFYERYEFCKVYTLLVNFCSQDLSSFYFEAIKDRLYADSPKSTSRRACQTVLQTALEVITKAIAPIMCFMAHEVHELVPEVLGCNTFATGWILPPRKWLSIDVSDWKILLALRSEVNKVIEEARRSKIVGSSLEASVVLCAPPYSQAGQILRLHRSSLPSLFITSQVRLFFMNPDAYTSSPGAFVRTTTLTHDNDGSTSPLCVSVTHAEGEKCMRCWKYSVLKTGALCPRCHSVVSIG